MSVDPYSTKRNDTEERETSNPGNVGISEKKGRQPPFFLLFKLDGQFMGADIVTLYVFTYVLKCCVTNWEKNTQHP